MEPENSRTPRPHVERLSALLRRVELAGLYQRAARARQTGGHQVELAAVEHLWAQGGLTPGGLGLTSGGVTALVGRLIEAGHVATASHPHDRRIKILTISPEGDAHLLRYVEPVLASADRVLACLSDAAAERLGRVLDPLAALKEHTAATTPDPQSEAGGEPYSPTLLM